MKAMLRRRFLRHAGCGLMGISLFDLSGCGVSDQNPSQAGRAPQPQPGSPAASQQPSSDPYSGFIVVRIVPPQPGRLATTRIDDLRTFAKEVGSAALAQVLSEYPNASTSRLITSISPEQLAELERRATQRGFPPRDSLANYWRVDARGLSDPERLLKSLARVPLVDLAYRELRPVDPSVNASDDTYASEQLYLDAAPVGIDARWAWGTANGSGAGVGFVDLEQSWLLKIGSVLTSVQHEDLPNAKQAPNIPREMNPKGCPPYHHGTAVVGIVAGLDNQKGIVGIAPTPAWIDVASHFQTGTPGHITNTLTAILQYEGMSEGDVLLIEYQTPDNNPVEADAAALAGIEMATALGFVVIEPAGNFGRDLDTVASLNKSSSTFRDSRAIIVGAGESQLDATGSGHDRWATEPADFALPGPLPSYIPNDPLCHYGEVPPMLPASNYGGRVDCYAWGEHVVASGYGWRGGSTDITSYTNRFSGTSAAAAIVAGAAVVLQGMHKAVTGKPLSPTDMRAALCTNGTPQGSGRPGHIGVMPDLRKAAMALSLMSSSSAPREPSNLRVIDR